MRSWMMEAALSGLRSSRKPCKRKKKSDIKHTKAAAVYVCVFSAVSPSSEEWFLIFLVKIPTTML